MELLASLEEYCKLKNLELKSYKEGAYIYQEGENSEGVYFLKEGSVKVTKLDKRKKRVFLWSAKPFESIGLASYFLNTKKYISSARAIGDTSLLFFLPNHEFAKLIEQSANLRLALLGMLCERLNFMEIRLNTILYNNAEKKVINTLLSLYINNTNVKKRQLLNFTMKELNEIIGISPEYFKKQIRSLKDLKLIDFGDNWISINNVEKLRCLGG